MSTGTAREGSSIMKRENILGQPPRSENLVDLEHGGNEDDHGYDNHDEEGASTGASSQFLEDGVVPNTNKGREDEKWDSDYDEEDDQDEEDDDQSPDQERDESAEIRKLAQRETTRVRIWKVILLAIIAATAAAVTAGTYRILKQEEEDDFETAYKLFSNTIRDSIRRHYSGMRLAVKSCTTAITASAVANGEEWPFVTVRDFEVLGESTRAQSGIEVMTWGPFVQPSQLPEWNNYSVANQDWIEISRATTLASSADLFKSSFYRPGGISPQLFSIPIPGVPVPPFHNPAWQTSPPPFSNFAINFDSMSTPQTQARQRIMAELNHGLFSYVSADQFQIDTVISREDHETYHASLVDWNKSSENVSATNNPHSYIYEPVYKEINNDRSEVVGQLIAYLAWDKYMVDLLPDGVNNITVVLKNTCNQSYTYDVRGNSAFYLGPGDLHDSAYNHMGVTTSFYDFGDDELVQEIGEGQVCIYNFEIYPTSTFEDEYTSSLPTILAVVVGSTFVFMALSFFVYDFFVQSRNRVVVGAAASSNALVSSMFPEQIRDQLLEQQKREQASKHKRGPHEGIAFSKNVEGMKNDEAEPSLQNDLGLPIADFYPETTIMFCDIVGFTAWSSVREPPQVFELLESVYSAFDKIAKRRRVFKVETVGDSYVAVSGLPEPRKDHAVTMARFARDCNYAMKNVVRQLEVSLGPETGDLGMRFGLHSGPVTAGVLRGERARFQLFGDTMNTASRMESTGKLDMIQISHDSAELLRAAGKGSWVTPREDMIHVKGKGMMVSYWLTASAERNGDSGTVTEGSISHTVAAGSSSDDGSLSMELGMVPEPIFQDPNGHMHGRTNSTDGKTTRLVKWNVGILSDILRRILSQRGTETHKSSTGTSSIGQLLDSSAVTVLDEVKEVISLPEFHEDSCSSNSDWKSLEIDTVIKDQLKDFVTAVAAMYRDNKFHNFEHASHVAMAVSKLLSRVVNPKLDIHGSALTVPQEDKASVLHDYTFGITSDPLVQFACVFSAMIHDLDHPGVPNTTLVKEHTQLAQVYGRSVAEQNSFDLTWNLFMDERYTDFRHAVCGSGDKDLQRFRQIVINLVMATDVLDKDLNGFRSKRWEKAFGASASQESIPHQTNNEAEETDKSQVDRKATIVIEHMIQAADVAHTMQHWHVYRKWNSRLFGEMYEAYLCGRSSHDPSENWYQGELNFFDFYIIPLAKKLSDCGVFGVSSLEYLNYAEHNRKEWADRGRQMVAEYQQEVLTAQQENKIKSSTTLAKGDAGMGA